jgi:hypothetical protein
MRIAHGLGIHRDEDGRAFSAFEAEMRRRLWWQILALDLRTADDRGFESILADSYFNTVMPYNLDDDDFKFDNQHPLQNRSGPTEMTLCLLTMDALSTGRKINFRSLASDLESLTLQEKEALVEQYAQRVKSSYLAGYDFSDSRTKLLFLTGHYWISKLWLILYYPLYHPIPMQQIQSRTQGLQTAMKFLNVHELIEEHPSSAGFTWLFKTYVPCHALAVVLVELCAQPQSPLADCAWEIIDSRFKDWNGRIADIKEVMLWALIKKLLKRARAARRRSDDSLALAQDLYIFELNLTLQDFDALRTSNPRLESSSFDPQSLNDFASIDPAMDQRMDFLSFAPVNQFAADVDPSSASNNLNNWNDFMFDVNALDGETSQN